MKIHTRTNENKLYPKEHSKRYLKLVNKTSFSEFNRLEVEKVFITAVADFIQYSLSLEGLSHICNDLFSKLIEDGQQAKVDDLFQAVLSGAELSYYVRQSFSGLEVNLEDIASYYRAHKREISSLLPEW